MLWAGGGGSCASGATNNDPLAAATATVAAGTGAALTLRACDGGASTSYADLAFESGPVAASPRLHRLPGGPRPAPFASVTSGCGGGPPPTVSLPVIPLLASANGSSRPFWRRGGSAQFVSLPIGVGNGKSRQGLRRGGLRIGHTASCFAQNIL